MSKAVLISIRPKWCNLIAIRKKTIEVLKTRPMLETPFKCYIYCTNGTPYLNRHNGKLYLEPKDSIGGQGYGLYERLSGKVIGEFVCDTIYEIKNVGNAFKVGKTPAETNRVARASCLDFGDMHDYLGHKGGYGWHISDLLIYDEPLWLSQMTAEKRGRGFYIRGPITRPPQSWCYVEDQKRAGKTIFGGGYLVSERAVAERAAAERAIEWDLSEREKEYIEIMSKKREES